MSERPTTRIYAADSVTFHGSSVDWDWAEFLAWVDGAKAEIPPEHAASARLEIERSGDDDFGHELELSIYFWRPMTDAEIAEREAERQRSQAARLAENEARERAIYELLKAKFGA